MNITDPAFNYDLHGQQYARIRQTDPRIAAYVHAALGNAQNILNVGAGAGSYEPENRYVIAVEPSAVMRSQRKTPAINAKAEALPFDDGAFDAAMAMVTVHHWPDIRKGLQELRRVTRGPIVVMSFDPAALDDFWMAHYGPELIAVEKARYPSLPFLMDALGGKVEIQKVPVPFDCVDGFQEAFYGRPELMLRPEVRKAQSAWGFLPEGVEEQIVSRLALALDSGKWEERYGYLRRQATFTGALRLVIARPA